MPKEVIHKGALYIRKTHPATDEIGEFWEELPFEPPILGADGIAEVTPFVEDDTTVLTVHPSLEVFWMKPSQRAPVAMYEDEQGFVQFGMDVSREEILAAAAELEKDPQITAKGFYTRSLTRYQMNKLVKVAQRARNQAYGADE